MGILHSDTHSGYNQVRRFVPVSNGLLTRRMIDPPSKYPYRVFFSCRKSVYPQDPARGHKKRKFLTIGPVRFAHSPKIPAENQPVITAPFIPPFHFRYAINPMPLGNRLCQLLSYYNSVIIRQVRIRKAHTLKASARMECILLLAANHSHF
jgi:hypothetical protein